MEFVFGLILLAATYLWCALLGQFLETILQTHVKNYTANDTVRMWVVLFLFDADAECIFYARVTGKMCVSIVWF